MRYKIILIAFLIILPMMVSAKIVPCGEDGNPCTLCHFVTLVKNFVTYTTTYLIGPAGVIALMIAGFMLITAGGDPGKRSQARDIFKYAIIGLLIALASYLIVDIILGNLVNIGSGGYIPVWDNFPGC